MTDFERKVEEELKKQQEAILKPNIAVVGGTGVGKSSLVIDFLVKILQKLVVENQFQKVWLGMKKKIFQ